MEKEIDIINLLRVYLHRWWVLLIGILVGGIISGVFTVLLRCMFPQGLCTRKTATMWLQKTLRTLI